MPWKTNGARVLPANSPSDSLGLERDAADSSQVFVRRRPIKRYTDKFGPVIRVTRAEQHGAIMSNGKLGYYAPSADHVAP